MNIVPKNNGNSQLIILPSRSYYSLSEEIQVILRKILKIVSKNNSYLVALFLVGKEKIRQLNWQYRKINSPTDVLTFPFYHAYRQEIDFSLHSSLDLGEIFICYPVVKEQAKKYQYSFKKEICFIFLHGLLHLLGYNHEKRPEKKIMLALQNEILAQIDI
jgi:probable rRNA maturation factor